MRFHVAMLSLGNRVPVSFRRGNPLVLARKRPSIDDAVPFATVVLIYIKAACGSSREHAYRDHRGCAGCWDRGGGVTSKQWLSMATMADPHDLLSTVRSLLTGAAALQDICCVGTQAGLDRARQALSSLIQPDDCIFSLLCDIEPLSGMPEAGVILATSGRILTVLKGTLSSQRRAERRGACVLSPVYRGLLLARLQKSDISLMVEAPDASTWASNSQILLRHSTTPVQGLSQSRS